MTAANLNPCSVVMPACTFSVPGRPIGKPRMTRRDKWKKRPCVLQYRTWADQCRAAANARMVIPNAEDVNEVTIIAHFTPPASWSKRKQEAVIGKLMRCKPDVDNICKSVLDAIWPDGDSAIASIYCRKYWSRQDETLITISDKAW